VYVKRVAVYIDGFNLYYAIRGLNKPWLKWLDLHKLSESFLREDEKLFAVHYFSAYATWDNEVFLRHREYVDALHAVGVKTHIGKFKHKPVKCLKCRHEWQKPEEKETDVNIAIQIVEDACMDRHERYILISADTDIVPAMKAAKRLQPKKQFHVIAPPKRFGSARELSPLFEITQGRLEKCLFNKEVYSFSGELCAERPEQYAPPNDNA
jgi:uncharacterized LabA/DUF88 family protein